LVAWPDLGALRRQGVRLRAAASRNDRAEWDSAAQALAQALWLPLASELAGVERLWLVPDGLLQVLPWRALPGADGRLLIESFEITQLGSARALVESAKHEAGTPRPAAALVMGAPDFGPSAAKPRAQQLSARSLEGLKFEPLPGALAEAQRVGAALAGQYRTEVLTGVSADKVALRRARSPALVHLATHGFYLDDPTRPERVDDDPLLAMAHTGLALAIRGSSPDAARGFLTALEATTLDLRGTRLVVLSACETALGQTARNDGVYGLVRAFQEAGALAVLGTLWPVEDDMTLEFMERFYGSMQTGLGPAAALQQTQLAFSRDARWGHPRHWAAFVLTGR
jgi:CHAT domain-containing protein